MPSPRFHATFARRPTDLGNPLLRASIEGEGGSTSAVALLARRSNGTVVR